MRFLLLPALLLSFLCLAQADQITFKNGDRLTGKILKSDDKNLVIKSDLAGNVTVPWDAVAGLTSTEILNVGTRDGQVVVGVTTTAGGKLEVSTKDAGQVTIDKANVEFIRSKEEQEAYQAQIERLRSPRLVDLWTGFVNLGAAVAQGNARTSNLSVTASASRSTSRDKTEVGFTSLYATDGTTGKSLVTANAIRGGIRYSLNVSPRMAVFGSTDLEYDQFQSLDLRFAPAGGIGYHAIKTDRTTLDLLGGASLDREFFSTGLKRTSGEVLVGEELNKKLNAIFSVNEKLTLFPNLTDTGNYRMNFDMSTVTNIRRWFAWQLSVSDRFLSNPVFGRKKNDILFTSGIRVSFGK